MSSHKEFQTSHFCLFRFFCLFWFNELCTRQHLGVNLSFIFDNIYIQKLTNRNIQTIENGKKLKIQYERDIDLSASILHTFEQK